MDRKIVAIGSDGTRLCAHVDTPSAQAVAVTDQGRDALDPELRDFIGAAFPTVWALETLLRLHRDPTRAWTPEALVADLRASGPLVHDCLGVLERAGLVAAHDGQWSYRPASPTIAALVDRLAPAYAERPFSVTGLITRKGLGPLRNFADSFRLGGWKS